MKESSDRRNPYLVLGLPYGAYVGEVRRAFARRSKEVAQGTLGGVDTADLTWALAQLEQSQADTTIDVSIYRVPANPSLFDEGLTGTGAIGFLDPGPTPIPRTTDSATTEDIDELASKALIQWLEVLLSTDGEAIKIPYPTPK
mgnify:FL=1